MIAIVLLLGALGFRLKEHRTPALEKPTNCLRYEVNDNKTGRCLLSFDLAQSPEAQARGLSGRPSLPEDNGLMFVFLSPGQQCFWMKDMQFPLDIIWLTPEKVVAHIEPNVSPDSYPQTFCPTVYAQYVLEVNAGVAGKLNIQKDQKLLF